MPSRKAVPGAIISSAFINPGSGLASYIEIFTGSQGHDHPF